MPSAKTTAKQRRLTETLRFIAAYDGGLANNRKAKRAGRQRVKRRSARLGRLEARHVIDAARTDAVNAGSSPTRRR